MDEAVVTQIDSHVRNRSTIRVEEHEVARTKTVHNSLADTIKLRRAARECDAGLLKTMDHKSRTVETVGSCSAIAIRSSIKVRGVRHHRCRRRRRR